MISVLCPTHKRPERQKIFADNVIQNCVDRNSIEIIFGIDKDDYVALSAAENLKKEYGEDLIRVALIEPGERMANLVNHCYKAAKGEIVCSAADDVVFASKKWDVVVHEIFDKIDDKILLVWSDDGLWNGQLAAHTFLHRNWVETVGYINAPYFYADWSDKWNQEIASAIGRCCCILDREILFLEHMHVTCGKMEIDETHIKTRKLAEKHRGDIQYGSDEMFMKRQDDARKLLKFIDEFHRNKP